MRHGNTNRKFGRMSNQRGALIRNLAIALFMHGKIETTEAKAKELRPIVERMITRGKSDSIMSRRVLSSRLNKETALKLVNEISPKFKEREGGYTRIRHLATRTSDGASMAVIELVA